jgi:hypothetical protein
MQSVREAVLRRCVRSAVTVGVPSDQWWSWRACARRIAAQTIRFAPVVKRSLDARPALYRRAARSSSWSLNELGCTSRCMSAWDHRATAEAGVSPHDRRRTPIGLVARAGRGWVVGAMVTLPRLRRRLRRAAHTEPEKPCRYRLKPPETVDHERRSNSYSMPVRSAMRTPSPLMRSLVSVRMWSNPARRRSSTSLDGGFRPPPGVLMMYIYAVQIRIHR